MKSFKSALLGLTLAAAASVAGATEVTGATFAFGDMSNAGTLQTYVAGTSASDLGAVAGDTFIYDIIFNTPPSETMYDWINYMVTPDTAGSVTFSSAALYSSDVSPAAYTETWSNLVTGYGTVLSGTYFLELTGTFLSDTAGFTMYAASDEANVPEPMSLALMGLGLAGIVGARRRRKPAPEQVAQAA